MNMKLDICKYGGALKMYNKQTFEQKGVEFGVRPSGAWKGGINIRRGKMKNGWAEKNEREQG